MARFIMPSSPVDRERKSAAYQAARQAIGRQLKDVYEIPHHCPVNIEALMRRLEPCDEPSDAGMDAAGALVEAAEQHTRTIYLLRRLNDKATDLTKAIEAARETLRASRARRLAASASPAFSI
jgi:hypothetical protein